MTLASQWAPSKTGQGDGLTAGGEDQQNPLEHQSVTQLCGWRGDLASTP